MPRSFNFKLRPAAGKPLTVARIVVGVLLAANLAAAYFVVRPPGGSPEELREQLTSSSAQLRQKRAALERTRTLVAKIESGRAQGDSFLAQFFLPRQVAYSTVLTELNEMAKQSRIQPRESSFSTDVVEGSDNLTMMTISAAFEGTYADLMRFLDKLDKSGRLLIVETLNATPQQGAAGLLNITLKLNTFVRDDGAADGAAR